MEVGRTFDLKDCVYGPAHWHGAGFSSQTHGYYAFLAGFVRTQGVRTIAELGTHYAGSTLAMRAGFDAGEGRLVTVDVTRLNEDGTRPFPEIQRHQGDSLDPDIIQAFMREFDAHIDLLYVDTIHTYDQTLENLSVYANRLKPRWIIVDDIRLNPQMRRLWSDLATLDVGELHDVSDLVERPRAGFGLIECRYPARWPESSPRVRAARRALWAARLAVATRTPELWKKRARALLHRVRP
jgi:hypothetical protein